MTEKGSVAPSNPVNVVIAGLSFGYPYGLGATARVHDLARGLLDSGARVHVVSLLTPSPHGGTGGNEAAVGVYEGVPFSYACGTRVRARTFLRRRLLEVKVPFGLWRVARRLFEGQQGPKVIIAYAREPALITFVACLARLAGAKCLVEICEMPFVYEHGVVKVAAKRWLQDLLAYKLVDGFIAISTCLEEYVRRHAPSRVPSLRVPTLVAISEFDAETAPSGADGPRQIVYVGDLRHEGEIPDLLVAFSYIAPDYSDVQLTLVGDSSSDRVALAAAVAQLELGDRVVFAGFVKRDILPRLLRDATVLVLPRRSGLFSQAGLPNKLGLYLASGRPVVVSATGDVPKYLAHGRSAFLVPPDDLACFAAQLRYVLDHEDDAQAVGVRGRLAAARHFDCRRHGERLNAFIRGL
jgi:glycosyltransferase involved in cell wall biosynthesis